MNHVHHDEGWILASLQQPTTDDLDDFNLVFIYHSEQGVQLANGLRLLADGSIYTHWRRTGLRKPSAPVMAESATFIPMPLVVLPEEPKKEEPKKPVPATEHRTGFSLVA